MIEVWDCYETSTRISKAVLDTREDISEEKTAPSLLPFFNMTSKIPGDSGTMDKQEFEIITVKETNCTAPERKTRTRDRSPDAATYNGESFNQTERSPENEDHATSEWSPDSESNASADSSPNQCSPINREQKGEFMCPLDRMRRLLRASLTENRKRGTMILKEILGVLEGWSGPNNQQATIDRIVLKAITETQSVDQDVEDEDRAAVEVTVRIRTFNINDDKLVRLCVLEEDRMTKINKTIVKLKEIDERNHEWLEQFPRYERKKQMKQAKNTLNTLKSMGIDEERYNMTKVSNEVIMTARIRIPTMPTQEHGKAENRGGGDIDVCKLESYDHDHDGQDRALWSNFAKVSVARSVTRQEVTTNTKADLACKE